MKPVLSSSLSLAGSAAVAVLAASTMLSGCGLGSPASDPSATTISAVQGKIMGGETAISGSTVTLWVTDPANSGYGVATNGSAGAQPVGTVTSGQDGAFNFTAAYTCPAGQFAYITSTGGDVTNGGGMINNDVVLVAALGSCANLQTSTQRNNTHVDIDEVSTVAAAYALGYFTTVDASTPGSQKVYIGAPANNNAATGSCTGTGTAMTCVSAGLSHAFANAASLVDAVRQDGTYPTGLAWQVTPNNTTGVVPQALIHTLADIMAYCTNSAGSTTGAGDGTPCGTLYTNAKPVVGSAPRDTFSAMLDIAKNPWNNVGTDTSTTCGGTASPGVTTGLFSLIGAVPPFGAALTCPPHDWSIAIDYTGASNSVSFGSPQFATLDANDNVYVITGNKYSSNANGLAAMSATGIGLWNVAQSANYCSAGEVAADAVGNVWMSTPTTTTGACAYGITQFSAAAGTTTNFFTGGSGTICNSSAPTSANCPGFTAYDTTHKIGSTPNDMAFDRFNNLWYGRSTTTVTTDLYELPYNSTTSTFGGAANTQTGITLPNQMIIDSNANIFIANQSTTSGTGGVIYLVPNTGTAAAPTYTATNGYTSATLPAYHNGGLGIDSAGNVWAGSASNMTEFTPTLSGSSSSLGAGTTTAISGTYPTIGEVDGSGYYWTTNLSNSGAIYVQVTPSSPFFSTTATNNTHYVRPCYVPAGSTTCESTLGGFYASGDPHSVQVDSAGSLWIPAGVSSTLTAGNVVQIIGAAAPTWPLLQYGVFGKMPQ